jgi:hypothetical protein
MVRMSLQQSDKDDFFAAICSLDVELMDEREISDNVSQTSQIVEVGSVASIRSEKGDPLLSEFPPPASPVTLLSLFGHVLSDPAVDSSEKVAVLEIIGGVAMHDPGLIRRHCLECHNGLHRDRQMTDSSGKIIMARPTPNTRKQVLFACPPSDLLASLVYLVDVEPDAGLLLQVTEIMRIILDSDMVGDHGPMNTFTDEAEPPEPIHGPSHDQHNQPSGLGATTTEQKHFLSLFYEHYVEWLVEPFRSTIVFPARRVPENILLNPADSALLTRMNASFHNGIPSDYSMFKIVPFCATRSSFAVELLSFCVRAHLYRMKFFLLKSKVLTNITNLLRPQGHARFRSGDRCLKLAVLRLLRAILSVKDEFYHRHIIQHNLFAPVFEALRANPVGDNLVSSAIVEMCDYIHSEEIKSLVEYIVTRHLLSTGPEDATPSLEELSSPYVSTLTALRKAYEADLKDAKKQQDGNQPSHDDSQHTATSNGQQHSRRILTGKALEDQRKFQELDQEESYFESDESDPVQPSMLAVVEEVGEKKEG